jgi:hypothetical protein
MSKRLGETLIAKGLLTEQELEQALQTQLISGGHLGTSLLDLEFIDEQTLGETLAKMQRLDLATRETLRDIPRPVIRLLSADLAEKHLAIPIKVEGNTLHLAVAAPKTLAALSSKTGYKIVPWIAPEIRIFEALETHYGIPRRPRYLRLCREIDVRPPKVRTPVAVGAAVGPSISGTDRRDRDSATEAEVFIDLPGADSGYGQDWRLIAERLESEEQTDQKKPRKKRRRKKKSSSRPRTRARKSSPEKRLENVLDRMCRAESKEDLSEAFLDYVSAKLATCMLLSVKSRTVRIWDCRGLDLEPETISGLRWMLNAGSIFTLLLGNTHYQGPVPDDLGCRHFYATLRMDTPKEVLLYPVYVNDKLVVIFYGDAGPGKIKGPTDTHLLLGEKLSLAMRTVILKMKIRAV